MEGDRRITLREPTPQTTNEIGEWVDGDPIDHAAWATRADRGGREGIAAETLVGEWAASFRVRRDGVERVNQSWTVTDDAGVEWDIERVSEIPLPPRRWLLLFCVARSGA